MTLNRIEDLVIYPVKSCRGISLKRASICPQGLRHDHNFLIFARKGLLDEWKFVDVKACSALVRVLPSIEGSLLKICYTPTGEFITTDL